MQHNVFKAFLIFVIPIIVFIGLGGVMMHVTGRDQFPQTESPVSVPLNFRPLGYDEVSAFAYWEWLGPEGREVERRFLIADLFFPIAYGGAMLASLLLAWRGLNRPLPFGWLAAPVVFAALADWVENITQLKQLSLFVAGRLLEPAWVWFASVATIAKVLLFLASVLLILGLCGRLAARRRS